MKKMILAFFIPLLLSIPAHALFEARLGYGINTPAEKDSLGSGNELKTMTGFNGDFIAEIPMVPVGIGLRYEMLGLDVKYSSVNLSTEFNRLSVLVNYRIIDLFVYLGVIGSLGISNKAKMKGVPLVGDVDLSKDLTYSAGVEGGLSLGLFMVGAELGYMKTGDFKVDTSGVSLAAGTSFNLDGVYAKIIAGVGF